MEQGYITSENVFSAQSITNLINASSGCPPGFCRATMILPSSLQFNRERKKLANA
jgi:hypothetical protein